MDGIEPSDLAWGWIVLGLALAGLEMLAPGIYLIWLALAALITGLIAFVAEPSFAVQIISFVSLALIAAFSAKRFLRDQPIMGADPTLNRPGHRYVGETALVTAALEGGSGRVRVGDGEWIARGPDTRKGERVRITGVSGTALTVEPLTLLADEATQPPEE